jgi:hypothetical protein
MGVCLTGVYLWACASWAYVSQACTYGRASHGRASHGRVSYGRVSYERVSYKVCISKACIHRARINHSARWGAEWHAVWCCGGPEWSRLEKTSYHKGLAQTRIVTSFSFSTSSSWPSFLSSINSASTHSTWSGIEQIRPLYYTHGANFCRRTQAALDNPESLVRDDLHNAYLQSLRQTEKQT